MDEIKEKKKPSGEKADEIVDSLMQKELKRWYVRWSEHPGNFAIISTLKIIPFALVFGLIFRWNKMKVLFTNPSRYLQQHWLLYLIGFLVLIIYYRFRWNQKAFRYFLYSRQDKISFPLDDDSKISINGEKRAEKLERKFRAWSSKKNALMISVAIILPSLFFLFMYFANGIKTNLWSYQQFMDLFDRGAALLVFLILMSFGGAIGYGIWREINDNYYLLQKSQKQVYAKSI